jgi:DNA polymerase-3 subunit alpha
MVSLGYTEGFYYKPRIDRELLEKYHEGLICATACLGGEVNQHLLRGEFDEALETACWLRNVFGPENFFIEIQNHQMKSEIEIIPPNAEIARKLEVGLLATNDSHYTNAEDWEAHDLLLCLQTKNQMNNPNRWRFPPGGQFYFKTGDEMAHLFKDYPKAIENSLKIAEMCNLDLIFKDQYHIPVFDVPPGHTDSSYFAEISREGLEDRMKVLKKLAAQGKLRHPLEDYTTRLEEEIKVINEMGFPGYFLITWDFIKHARETQVPVGPGRGSAAGSLVAYALQITDIDPLQYDLLFERFLNKERISMPDIDIDFCKAKRGEVIDYVTRKYGSENVCQIITYGSMNAKMALKDVGRAMGFTPTETNRIAKLIPEELKMTLEKALEKSPDFKEVYEGGEREKQLIDMSKTIEGLSRNTGVHAAGVIIAPKPVTDFAPVYRDKKNVTCIQYAKEESEDIGLLKFDFLGLKTLTTISTALELIEETLGETVVLEDLKSFDDPKTYELFAKGETDGVFQFESDGMKNILIRLGPKRFEDFIALNALYRPGPLGSGMVDQFIEGAHGAKIPYELPELEPILEETYGVILYQEQVMKIAQLIGGFSLGEADLLRRAMGKKKTEIMTQKKDEFLAGAKERGYPLEVCSHIFDKMAEFAKYGFNKSHSAAYSLVAYQTAYLKANYPVQFMAAILTMDKDDTDKVVAYIEKCKQMGIRVLPPDIRYSKSSFSVELVDNETQVIRFGLGAIKGIGGAAMEALLELTRDHKIKTYHEFFEKVNVKSINKTVVGQLIKGGAFDFAGLTRRAMFETVEDMLSWGTSIQKDQDSAQETLFADLSGEAMCYVKFHKKKWELGEMLAYEKQTLGFYVSGHPLDPYRALFQKNTTCSTRSFNGLQQGTEVIIGGMVQSLRTIQTKKGDAMAFINFEDVFGTMDVTVFPRSYEKYRHFFQIDKALILKGKVEIKDDKHQMILNEAIDLEDWEIDQIRNCYFSFDSRNVTEEDLLSLNKHLLANRGSCQVYLEISVDGQYQTVVHPQTGGIQPGPSLAEFLKKNTCFKTRFVF